MAKIIASIISLGGMGLIFGSLLAYASKKFAVEADERISIITEILPGANCGGCNYTGCAALATAIVDGIAPIDACPVGGEASAKAIAEVMGVTVKGKERKIARILCAGTKDKAKEKYKYHGLKDCLAASQINGGFKSCEYGCLGLGTCVNACQFDAITIKDDIANIDENKCTACGMCVQSCPRNLIELIPESKKTWVMCKSLERGPVVRTQCDVGCIACKICEKACEFDAIHVIDNIALIDYEKCTNCNECVNKCPKKIIHGKLQGV